MLPRMLPFSTKKVGKLVYFEEVKFMVLTVCFSVVYFW